MKKAAAFPTAVWLSSIADVKKLPRVFREIDFSTSARAVPRWSRCFPCTTCRVEIATQRHRRVSCRPTTRARHAIGPRSSIPFPTNFAATQINESSSCWKPTHWRTWRRTSPPELRGGGRTVSTVDGLCCLEIVDAARLDLPGRRARRLAGMGRQPSQGDLQGRPGAGWRCRQDSGLFRERVELQRPARRRRQAHGGIEPVPE